MKVPANVLKLYKKGSESNRFKKKIFAILFHNYIFSMVHWYYVWFKKKKNHTHKKDKQGQRSSSSASKRKFIRKQNHCPDFEMSVQHLQKNIFGKKYLINSKDL